MEFAIKVKVLIWYLKEYSTTFGTCARLFVALIMVAAVNWHMTLTGFAIIRDQKVGYFHNNVEIQTQNGGEFDKLCRGVTS